MIVSEVAALVCGVFLLARLGFTPGGLDGWFGAQTRSAVKALQTARHLLPVDGVVGDQTWAALEKPAA